VLRVRVGAAEAEGLARRGERLTRLERLVAFLRRRSGWWIGILVTALIVPAIGKQWSDRNQELLLKNGLVASLSSEAATAITSADEIAGRGGSAARQRTAMAAWTLSKSGLTGSFLVYFAPHGAVLDMWSNTLKNPTTYDTVGLRDVITYYLELACCDKNAVDTATEADDITGFLAKIDDCGVSCKKAERAILENRDHEDQSLFRHAFHRLGLRLFDARNKFLDALVHAHAQGFSDGWGDFIHNVSHPVG
jgi:hypothetical protein